MTKRDVMKRAHEIARLMVGVADVRPRYERTWGYLDLVTGRFVWEVPYTNPTLFSTVEAAVKHYARRAA